MVLSFRNSYSWRLFCNNISVKITRNKIRYCTNSKGKIYKPIKPNEGSECKKIIQSISSYRFILCKINWFYFVLISMLIWKRFKKIQNIYFPQVLKFIMLITAMHNGRQKNRKLRSIYQSILNVIIKTEKRIYFLPSIFNAMVIHNY